MSTWKQATARALQRAPERSRCEPTYCRQSNACDRTSCDRRGPVIDASVTLRVLRTCPMFIDSRTIEPS